ncbi:MAG: Alanine racemase, partial [Pseudomonadota bacterium]
MSKKNIFFIYIFLLVLGSLSSFSLPPYNLIFINFITYSLFFFLGFTFGYGYFVSSLYWVSHSLTFDKQLTFLMPIAILGLPVLLAIFYGFAVLALNEAIDLREHGFEQDILLLEGAFESYEISIAAKMRFNLVVHNLHQLQMIEKLKLNHPIDIHFKINT